MDSKNYTTIRNTILVAFVLLSSFLGIFTSTVSQYFIKSFLYTENIPKVAVNEVLTKIIAVGTGVTLIGVILVILIAIKITNPLAESIKKLTEAMLQVDRGNWNVKVSIKDNNEIGIMAQTFNTMVKSLNETSVSKNYLDNILSTMQEVLIVLDKDGVIKSLNPAARIMLADPEEKLIGNSFSTLCNTFSKEENWFRLLKGEIKREEVFLKGEYGEEIPVLFSASYMNDSKDGNVVVCTATDMSEKYRSEKIKEEMQKKLLEVSREAGMSEVATGVLHNVGNILNSINISVGVLRNRLRETSTTDFFKVMDVLRERGGEDLSKFIQNDEQGKMFLPALMALRRQIEQEQLSFNQEYAELERHVENIKNIVYIQQSVAKKGGMIEKFNINEIISQAVNINRNAFHRHGIVYSEQLEDDFEVETDRLKVLQILINLLSNAKDALKDSVNKTIQLQVNKEMDMVIIRVVDSGIGIPKEDLNKIFLYGYTTKKDGHGFGLHNSALAAKEMGGQLEVASEGVGKGAQFVFSFPCKHRLVKI